MTIPLHRIAGAPITWGVCEVPGWGVQLPADRVLRELSTVGLTATELGPAGFLPTDPTDTRALLQHHGIRLVAGFLPVVLHRPELLEAEARAVTQQAGILAGAGAEILVVAASTGRDGYEAGGDLDDAGWADLRAAIRRVEAIASDHGLRLVLHPHYGTMIERDDHVRRLLAETSVALCLDIGHLMVGGADPVEVARTALDRIRHVHLKDVDAELAKGVRVGEVSYRDAVARGLYRVLGEGDVDVPAIVRLLEESGYGGWYVLEQDTVLDAVPAGADGPAANAAASVRYMEGIAVA